MRSLKIFLPLLLLSMLSGCGQAKEETAPPPTPAAVQEQPPAAAATGEAAQQAEAEKQAEAAKVLADLAAFEVVKARFYKTEEAYLGKRQPRIEITVKNNTASPVVRADFIGTLVSPDGEEVFLRQSFSRKFAQGVAPGEEKQEDFGLNMYSPWAEVEVPEETVLKVEVVKLEERSGKI